MTRTALIVVSIVAVLLAGIAHVNASGKQAADATIAELEARIEALETAVIYPAENISYDHQGYISSLAGVTMESNRVGFACSAQPLASIVTAEEAQRFTRITETWQAMSCIRLPAHLNTQ
ncbi:MAG: hypothetical protein M3464_12130 [Chloroflexota bacterium]|nr:hypothetical protein [Chloroflexota bacterium]